MWFFLALLVVGFILSAFSTPKMKTENAKASSLDDFSFPRSKEGDPVGRFYGTLKLISPNTIGLANFQSKPIKKKVKTGPFSSKKIITGYEYRSTVDLAFALGPGVLFRRLWFGENLVLGQCPGGCVTEVNLNLPELYGGSKDGGRGGIGGTVVFYCGDFDQPRDPVLAAQISEDIPAYVGVAHVVFRDFWWGNSPSIDTVAVEAAYFSNSLQVPGGKHFMPNGLDANLVEVLYDILVNDWGNLGFDASLIDVENWREAAATLWAEGNGGSLSIANSTQGTDVAKQILRQINGIIYEDQVSGLVKLDLLRNDYNIEDLPVLSPSEIVEVRNYTKKLWQETNNVVRVKYTDREADYAADRLAVAKDTALMRFQRRERPVEIVMPAVFVAALATQLASRELSNLNVPLYSCELLLNRSISSLRPGKPFIFHWPEYGIELMVMRIRKIGMGTLKDGKISISCVQDEFSLDATVISAPVPSGYTPTALVPQNILEYRVYELPAFLDYNAALGTLAGNTRLMTFATAPTSYTLGYDAYIEDTGEDAEVLTLSPYSDTALLVDDLARFAGWDAGVVIALTISDVSNPAILSPAPDTRLAAGLFLLGDELLAYESSTDNGDGSWTLGNVHRAFFDTNWLEHEAGDTIYFFDGQEGFFDDDTSPGIAKNVYLIDRTAAGSSSFDEATVTAIIPEGRVDRVIAPDYVTVNGNRDADQEFLTDEVITINARARNRNDVAVAWYEDDVASAAEAGTTYEVSTETAGVVTLVEDEVTLPYDLTTTAGMSGPTVIRIRAKRDGLYSISYAPMPIIVVNSDSLEIDGDIVTIDAETVEFS